VVLFLQETCHGVNIVDYSGRWSPRDMLECFVAIVLILQKVAEWTPNWSA